MLTLRSLLGMGQALISVCRDLVSRPVWSPFTCRDALEARGFSPWLRNSGWFWKGLRVQVSTLGSPQTGIQCLVYSHSRARGYNHLSRWTRGGERDKGGRNSSSCSQWYRLRPKATEVMCWAQHKTAHVCASAVTSSCYNSVCKVAFALPCMSMGSA